jgi:GxxExxY protein
MRLGDIDPETNRVTGLVQDAAIEVHRTLGPGLLEKAYEACLAWELVSRGLRVRRQVPIPLPYKGQPMGLGFRADLIVEERVLVEIKSVETLHKVHWAQVKTYLKISGIQAAWLFNFNEVPLKAGAHRIVASASAVSK